MKGIVFTISPDNIYVERAINAVISIRCSGCHIPAFFTTPNIPIRKSPYNRLMSELCIENTVISIRPPHDQWPSAKSIAPSILATVEQALVLDADIICLKDLTPIFHEQPDKQFLARPSSRYLHRNSQENYHWDVFTELRWQKYLKTVGVISEINTSLLRIQEEIMAGTVSPEAALQMCPFELSNAPINSGVYVLRRIAEDRLIGERLALKQQELLMRARCGDWCWPYDTGFFTMDEHALFAAVRLLNLNSGILPEPYHVFGWRLKKHEVNGTLNKAVLIHTSDKEYQTTVLQK